MWRRLSLLAVPFLGGCIVVAAAAVGAAVALGTYKYVENELQRDYEGDYEKMWTATTRAVRDLGFHGITENHDFQKGIVECFRADDEPVRIVVEKLDAKTVHIGVRVGTFESDAHRSAAEAIHDRILQRSK